MNKRNDSLVEDLEKSNKMCLLKIKKRDDNDFGGSAISIEDNMENKNYDNSIKFEKQKSFKSDEHCSIQNLKEEIDDGYKNEKEEYVDNCVNVRNFNMNDSFALSVDLVNQNLSIDLHQETPLKRKISDFYTTFKIEINKDYLIYGSNKKKIQRGSVRHRNKSQKNFFNINIQNEEIERNSLNNSQNILATSIDKKYSKEIPSSICQKFSFHVPKEETNNLNCFYSPNQNPGNKKKSIFGEDKKDIFENSNNNNQLNKIRFASSKKLSGFAEEHSNNSKFSLNVHEIEDIEDYSFDKSNNSKKIHSHSLVVNNFSQNIFQNNNNKILNDNLFVNNENNILDKLEENKSKSFTSNNDAVIFTNDINIGNEEIEIEQNVINEDSVDTEYKTFLRQRTTHIEYLKQLEHEVKKNNNNVIIKKNSSVVLPVNIKKKYQSTNILPNSENVKDVKQQYRENPNVEKSKYKNFQTIVSLHSEFNLNSNKKKYKQKQRQIIKAFDNSKSSNQKQNLKFKSTSSIESGDSYQELKLEKQYCVICGDGFKYL